ncbi:helix-turn-helix domain-containing protein [Pontivivens insulae]|nr:helix-turn-helix transcriptional regulator [Pontivivens insulae]
MAQTKIYAGAKLRDLRRSEGLTQKEFAARLGVSLSYLNQMENNHRPVASAVLLGLAREFGFDITSLDAGEAERLVADMREALADPGLGEVPLADLSLVASNAPALARAFLTLHRQQRDVAERMGTLDDRMRETAHIPQPWEEVRDFFHYCDNYIDSIDRAAEHFAATVLVGREPLNDLAGWFDDHGLALAFSDTSAARHFDGITLHLSRQTDPATQRFQVLHQVARIAYADLIGATLDFARFSSDSARDIAGIGLANYFAGAAMMPYTRFAETAQATRHDLEHLALTFGASLEQVAHRLSTLQRQGAKGVPFFFVRVDPAGTITKRHSATRLQFARFGGACPLWNVHQAFETPGRFLRQVAETPDGVRYFCLAREVTKPARSYQARVPRHAIGLGCELQHADALIYADDMDVGPGAQPEPIGVSCRTCPRPDCHQRALPPLEAPVRIDPNLRGTLPYALG